MIVGIDVSKEKLDLAVPCSGRYRTEQFANKLNAFKSLLQWCQARAKGEPVEFCLEPTGRYGEAFADWLCEQSLIVHMVDPAQIHDFRKALKEREKTDVTDAILICQFAEKHETRVYQPPSPTLRALRSLVRRREELVTARTQELNRRQECSTEAFDQERKTSLDASIAWQDREIARLEDNIKNLIQGDPALQKNVELVQSVPGIGFITGFKLLAEIPEGIDTADALDQYAGLVPCRRESGKSRKRPHISRASNGRIRTALYLSAATVLRSVNPFSDFFIRLMSRQGPQHKMVALVAVMRKLLHVVFGVLKNQQPYNPALVTKPARQMA